jgi:hypothetical protein
LASATLLRQTEGNDHVWLFSMHKCGCFGYAFSMWSHGLIKVAATELERQVGDDE